MARQLGTEPAGGAVTDALDLAERLDVGVQGGRGGNEVVDLGFEPGGLLAQTGEHAGQALFDHGVRGGLETIGLGLEMGFDFVEAAQQVTQELLVLGRWLPGGQGAGGSEAGDDLGIDLIGFITAAEAAGVVLNAAGVGDVHPEAGGLESGGGQIAVATGSLRDRGRRGGAVFLASGQETLEAGLGVIELMLVVAGVGQKEAGIEFGFGNVDAEAGG